MSLYTIKKNYLSSKKDSTLRDFFDKAFADDFEECQRNFVESLGGYCLFNYIFGVRGRTAENVLIDADGRMIHLDFTQMLQVPIARGTTHSAA